MQGALTFITVHRLFGLAGTDYGLRLAMPLAVLAGAVGIAARPLIDDSAAPLALLVLLELALAAAYFGGAVESPSRLGAPGPRTLPDGPRGLTERHAHAARAPHAPHDRAHTETTPLPRHGGRGR